jgi:hypothetical protein
MGIRGYVRRRLNLDRPANHHTAFIRACLPDNARGTQDLERWLAFVGGPEALAEPDNPFKPNLPALAYALDQRGEKPSGRLRAVLKFTQLVEPRRAERYSAIIQRLTTRMIDAGLPAYLAGDAAAAQRAYPRIEIRHIAGVEIVAAERHLPQLQALCAAEGFVRRRDLPGFLELCDEHGARLLLTSRLFRHDRRHLTDALPAHPGGGLQPLPAPLLFISRCIAGYPPVDALHAPAMVDAALLAPLLTAEDWAAVADLMGYARRDRFVTALRYLRDALDVAVPLKI